ncbi:MAG: DUF4330 domain-containing protein [Elainellaceae cyanobacterium]
MAILDSRGRLFGRIGILDAGAVLVVLLTVAGIFFVPGDSGSVAQIGAQTQPVEVDVMVRGLTVSDPQGLINQIREEGETEVIIRNQPFGQVNVKSIEELPRSVAAPQPDGTLKSIPDPRPELGFTLDMMITLADDAQVTDDSVVFGNNKVKIGNVVELEGQTYRFNTTVVGVRILEE